MARRPFVLSLIIVVSATAASPRAVRGRDVVPIAPVATLTADVDALLARAWSAAAIRPAADAAPGPLCRRVHLDLAGRPPTVEETRAFVADADPERLAKLADRLLASPEHARHLAEQLTVVWLSREWNREGLSPEAFRVWLAARIAEDAPFDAVVRSLLTATGKATENPASYYLLAADAPPDLAGRTARLFLGRRIQCAQCHDHPYEPWKKVDFWGVAAFFQHVRRNAIRAPVTPEMRKRRQIPPVVEWELKEEGQEETRIPLQPGEEGRPLLALPRVLGGSYDFALLKRGAARLPALAREVLERERPAFARALANRLFAHLFGRGAVHPVDDFSDAHAPGVPGLLDVLARGFEEGRLRARPFLRALVLTRAYSRASDPAGPPPEVSVPDAATAKGEKWPARAQAEDPALALFARFRHKPLAPEVAVRALATATGADAAAAAAGRPAEEAWARRRADMLRRFSLLLARHDEEDPHLAQESIPNALVLMNGPDVNDLCLPRKGSIAGRALEEKSLEARVDLLALAAFSRPPTDAERARFVSFLSKNARNAPAACQDLLWSMLNTTEFQYGH